MSRLKSMFVETSFWNAMEDMYRHNQMYIGSNWQKLSSKFDIDFVAGQWEKLFFPINIDNFHWVLAVVVMKEKEVALYDSQAPEPTKGTYLERAEDIFDKFKNWFKILHLDYENWTYSRKQCSPQGRLDCGVSVCMNCQNLSSLPTIEVNCSISNEDYAEHRLKIGVALLRKSEEDKNKLIVPVAKQKKK